MKLDILAIGAHPDDVELGCGATLAKEISLGKKVGIIDLTRGELGTRGSAEIRDKEASDAAKILGISVRENLRFADGFFKNDEQHQLEVVKMIRKYRPNIVLCNAVDDRHIDHPKGSKLVSDACFFFDYRKMKLVRFLYLQERVCHDLTAHKKRQGPYRALPMIIERRGD